LGLPGAPAGAVRDADHIYVLDRGRDRGRILEHGSHDQLMATGRVQVPALA
jgi:hypothetical protein